MPVNNVERAFDVLVLNVPDDDKVVEFVSYFERTFIGDSNGRRRRRRPPLFSHEMWNKFEDVMRDLPRTNNAVEAWHNAFKKSLRGNHNINICLTYADIYVMLTR